MSQRIHNGAIVIREGRLLLLRPSVSGPWQLPGGEVLPEHPDVDEAMDLMLRKIGIKTPAIEEDFVETIYLRDEDGHIVYNIYAASEWEGDVQAAPGTGTGWFALEELETIAMHTTVRDTVLSLFGVRERRDDTSDILAALSGESPIETAPAEVRPEGPVERRDAGLDVLRTLRGGGEPARAFEEMRKVQPGLADDIVDFALGEVWSHPALDRKTRSLQVVAMLSALGRTGPLRSHLNGALNHGASAEQIVQTIRMVAVYAGFPAAIEAWRVMSDVFAERNIAIPGGAQ